MTALAVFLVGFCISYDLKKIADAIKDLKK